ncbi:PX domain-containing protein YPT35 [Choanephora cucurbitarum]|uniref:Endosomal/vacuolar adapter protein YPT35 n=1 Tax=Choanephora cucurbitarum TaxID=101091 RepID=A0A1C7N6N0_9FUNG|nr:PX domain-containing protein YPT35 [Choanephora cucurbitarum]
MTDYQQTINNVLEHAQSEYAHMEVMIKQKKTTPLLQQTAKDLREGIKKLVQLQDNLDDIGSVVESNTEWIKRAETVLSEVKKQLQIAKNISVTHINTNMKPMTSQSSPLKLSNAQRHKINYDFDIQEEEEEEEEDRFEDASEELNISKRGSKLLAKLAESSPIERTEAAETTFPTSISNQQEPSRSVFGRRSVLVNNLIDDQHTEQNEKKPKASLFPLLRGLRTSQSTPVNNSAPVHINFYQNDNVQKGDKDFIFATDAIVDHPLRIGAGYGSYICYNCTVLSDKGTPITVRKRYSDFVDLREDLVKQYPMLKRSIPKLPPKKVVGKFTPSFVEQRRKDLEYFFKYVVLHPTLGASPIIKHWIAP